MLKTILLGVLMVLSISTLTVSLAMISVKDAQTRYQRLLNK